MKLSNILSSTILYASLLGCVNQDRTQDLSGRLPPMEYSFQESKVERQEKNPLGKEASKNTYQDSSDPKLIGEENLIGIAIEKNPDIRAGRFSTDFVDLLSRYNRNKYTPQFNLGTSAERRRRLRTTEDSNLRDYENNVSGEVSVSQRFASGLSLEVYADNVLEKDSSNGIYGAEVKYSLPFSATIARQMVSDLQELQEPAKTEAGFVASMRSKLEVIVNEFYNFHYNNKWLEAERDLKQPYLNRIKSVLEKRVKENPKDNGAVSGLQSVETALQKSKELSENTLPRIIQRIKINLFSDLGIKESAIQYSSTDENFKIPQYDETLKSIMSSDPLLKRYGIEKEIAEANISASGKEWDVSLVAGSFRNYTGDQRGDDYLGLEFTFNTSIFGLFSENYGQGLLKRAHRSNFDSFNAASISRIEKIRVETSEIYSKLAERRESMKRSKLEIPRKKEALESAMKAFNEKEDWATVERMLSLTDSYVSSEVDLVSRSIEVKNYLYSLNINSGIYDKKLH